MCELHIRIPVTLKVSSLLVHIEVSGVGERLVSGEIQSGICQRGEITCKILAMSQMNSVH